MLENIPSRAAGCKSFGDIAQTFVTLAVFSCSDKSEQKERILLAYEAGCFDRHAVSQLIRTLGLKEA